GIGKKDPLSNHIGISPSIMIAWKPCVLSIGQATIIPSEHIAIAITANSTRTPTTETENGAAPNRYTKPKNTAACTQAIADPPSTLPTKTGQRPTGATRTDCMNPSRRSSMTEMVAKMAVNSTINAIVPGKKYSMKFCSPAPTNEPCKPVPKSNQNSSGWMTAEVTRLRWRKNRTHSRLASIQAAAVPLGRLRATAARGTPGDAVGTGGMMLGGGCVIVDMAE